ncbi:hypothetical protein TL16_g01212 [Triparma laevis f. inornata]|uniref:Alkyl transferase n=2 Tax=Triparma laevis TaxID=1534972 RepID=A0A9W7CGA3_9STRA|nr:hypothetical protein TL16_g01212 [Triparma laevis f. inornata]GMI05145.1 hypothetical protein TrLO_g2266 [Triparma laevis f. longispina]
MTVSFVAAMTIMVALVSAVQAFRSSSLNNSQNNNQNSNLVKDDRGATNNATNNASFSAPSFTPSKKNKKKIRKKKKKGITPSSTNSSDSSSASSPPSVPSGSLANPQTESENPNSPPPRSLLHLGVIMDGNRRFGRSKYANSDGNDGTNPDIPSGYLRGHYDGGMKLVDFISWCIKLRNLSPSPFLSHLTIYAFSSENYSRPSTELTALHSVFMSFCSTLITKANTWKLRVQLFSTDGLSKMPKNVATAFVELVEATKNNTGMVLNVCVGYGGRDEILNGVKSVVEDVKSKVIDYEDVFNMTGEEFEEYLSGGSKVTKPLANLNLPAQAKPPPLDVVLRTSGERRISNFLIWQCAYSELFFLEKTWPEVEEKDLRRVKEEFESRIRRFGK